LIFRTLSNLLLHQGKADLAARWEVYAKTQMLDRLALFLLPEKEKQKSKVVTLCHGDAW
jgi:hypothetical protein